MLSWLSAGAIHRFPLRRYFRSPLSQKERMEARSAASRTLPPLCRYFLSLNKLEADILQGGRLNKKSSATYMRKFAARRVSRPFVGPRLAAARALPFFAFARTSSSRYALVRASRRRDNELLLSRKTTSLSFPSHAHIRNRYNEPSAEHNYFARF